MSCCTPMLLVANYLINALVLSLVLKIRREQKAQVRRAIEKGEGRE